MDLTKIAEKLGIDKLDESKQEEVKGKLEEIVNLKVDEKVKEKTENLKEELTEQYEEKFDEYKNDITEKFSDFVDEIINEEMEIPEKVKEYARKGELYEDVIDALKTRIAVDEGHIDSEMKDLLGECKTEITNLKSKNDKLTSENLEVKSDAKHLSAYAYIQEKCEGLPFKKKEKVMSLLEGETDKSKIDSRFDIITETIEDDGSGENDLNEEDTKGKGKSETDDNLNEEQNNPMVDFWLQEMNKVKQ